MALSYKNDEDQDERLNPAAHTARQLQEQEMGQPAIDAGVDQLEAYANDPSNASSKNLDSARNQEEQGGAGGWANNVSGNSQQKTALTTRFKKKAPLWLIGLIVGGLGSMTLLLSPAIALMHIKEIIVNKFDTMSSVLEERSVLIMKDRMFSTTAGCKIKVKCSFNGLSERQMSRLKAQGVELRGSDGKPVTKNALGRYTGGKTLHLASGETVTASDFKSKYFTSPELRNVGRIVYSSRFLSFNDSTARKIRADKKLVSNPKWGEEGDEKSTRQSIHSAVEGDSSTATSDSPKTQTGEDGKPLPANEQPIDFGEDTADINKEAERLSSLASSGSEVSNLPSDVVGAAEEAPFQAAPKSAIKGIIGFLNPADIAVGLCTTYKFTNAVVDAAKLIQLTNKMRFASQFLSTSDKLVAGDGTSTEAEKPMTILERPDQYGNTFGDSFNYQYAAYNTITDTPIYSSADGNEVTRILSTIIDTVNGAFGGGTTVRTACHIITNPWVQGALALTSFIPGAGEAFKGIGAVVAEGAKEGGKLAIQDVMKKVTDKVVEKVASADVKTVAKQASKDLWQIAKKPLALFLAGYLLERYGVPYLARVISGTDLTADMDGPTAMDTTVTGFNAINATTAQQRSMPALTKDEVQAFNQFNTKSTATYVADMQASSNPFDLYNPYSAGNAMASAYYTFASKLNLFNGSSFNPLSATSAILSSLNPAKLLSSSSFADDNQTQASLNYCPDKFLQDHNLATTPDCSVIHGFADIGMLQNTDPDTGVADYMLSNNQIDDNGDPVPGSAYADYQSKCVDGSDMKVIDDVGDDSHMLDPECYDPAKNATEQFKMFQLYNFDNGVKDGMDNGTEGTPAGSTAATAAPTGDAASLAQQILASPNVQFQTAAEKPLFQTIADTGKQTLINGPSPIDGTPIQGCDGTAQVPISSKLMSIILAASQKYKLTLGVVASGHDCDNAYHPQGQAIDINGVAHLDQPFVHSYTWTGTQTAMAKEFYEFLDNTAAQSNTHLELGQKYCFGNTPPLLSSSTLVKDDCTHIHVGVTSP